MISEKEAAIQEERLKFIGSSEVAGVLGMSPWPSQTPLAVWSRKTRRALPEEAALDPEREKIFFRGKMMEPVVIKMLEREYPIKVTARSTEDKQIRYIDKEHDFLSAQIDFEWEVTKEMIALFPDQIDPVLLGTVQNGEVKTARPGYARKAYGEEGTDEIPIEYGYQAISGLRVTGRDLTLFPVLVGSDDLRLYWFRRRDVEGTIAEIVDGLVRFWVDNVLADKAPDPINLTDLYRLYDPDQARKREATPSVSAMIQTLRVLNARKRTTEEAIEALKYEIGLFVLGGDLVEKPKADQIGKWAITVDGKPQLTVAYETRTTVDADKLAREHPEIALACEKESSFWKFLLKRNTP